MVNEQYSYDELPDFLGEYLSTGGNKSLLGSEAVEYLFYPDQQWTYLSDGNYFEIFRTVYSLLINRFGFEFSSIINDNKELKINSEEEFLKYKIGELKYFSFYLVMNCPINWINFETKEFGCSLLNDGFQMSCNIVNSIGGGSPFSFGFYYYHILFSNNIVKWKSFGSDKPELFYFEPASTINRLKARNIALEIKALYPNIVIEFSGRRSRIRPYDNYGFLEGADYVINPED